MSPPETGQYALDYRRVEGAIWFIEAHFRRQPSLGEIAEAIHMSEFHFQRLFSQWVGISPKRFLQYLTKEYAKELLRESRNILDATYESGLSSPGRLHDLFVTCGAVTPGEDKKERVDLEIEHGFHSTPFGECLIATTPRGVCALSFLPKGKEHELEIGRKIWPKAAFRGERRRDVSSGEENLLPLES
jgi:AraC family transcriptional regulator of adaptative response/methylated-DNA-[protein]-cysteine methyltransferase